MCLETHGEPGQSGKVLLHFVIGGDGRVKTASVEESTLENERVESCIGPHG